jgi:hypothetical protein
VRRVILKIAAQRMSGVRCAEAYMDCFTLWPTIYGLIINPESIRGAVALTRVLSLGKIRYCRSYVRLLNGSLEVEHARRAQRYL